MGKVLRVLVFVILALSAISLLFATKLFQKQELLGKRNSMLEDQLIKLAKTIEAADAADATAPSVQKDISEVSDREIANPEKESVLEAYPIKLEQQNLPTLDFGSTDKRLQLRNYFALKPDGSYDPDPVDNKPRVKGPGTMQELMDQLFDRAKAQQAVLNKTRAELAKMREQFTAAIEESNKLKGSSRTAKIELKTAKEQVAAITAEKEALDGRISKLTSEKKEMAAELADAKNEVEKANEEKLTVNEELVKVNQKYEELKERFTAGTRKLAGTMQNETSSTVTALTAGDKGKVIETNDELKFVIIDFSAEAIAEMLGADRQNQLPQLEMNIRRPGRQSAAGEFVTRIKLRQAVLGKNLVVADILNDWQQVPVEKNDVVFF